MGTPSDTAVKYLFAHSRNLCFFNLPGEYACEFTLTEPHFKRCRGEIAHIRADAPNGPRYDPNQPETDRQSHENLMLLCTNCHRRIDHLEPDKFDVQALIEMKARHIEHEAPNWKPGPGLVEFVVRDMLAHYVERASPSGIMTATAEVTPGPREPAASPSTVALKVTTPSPSASGGGAASPRTVKVAADPRSVVGMVGDSRPTEDQATAVESQQN